MEAGITGFFDPATCTVSYVLADPATGRAAIIDPVLDYDPKSGRTGTASADALIAHVRAEGLAVDWILETHVHADHLSAAPYLQAALGGRVGIGARVTAVQAAFGRLFDAGPDFVPDGRQFDRLFQDGDSIAVGGLALRAMHTPGHTPACATYIVGDAAFTGDTLFMPDFGTARCDFPGGDAAELYRSIQKILSLPPATRLFVGHDYMPGGRAPKWESTVAAQRDGNLHLRGAVGEAAFVAMRRERDRTLPVPVLLLPAVQVNMRAGRLPPAEANGIAYLKIPLNAL